ncbi:hypothetical protein VE01_06030 [Pseudogymnoascus verrucosus]|uniref:Octanoyltransferase n=1 Tax=Pseudogymnoascus verrucosus TaxID=342668 RepID=A0A1B8GJ72_9PEZI|nr:uncharacterized protein VE01_06030 [Pseudogymnoascus verrucosus]OBT95869.1 hypothetical protein VE01_06030 [Pseudogymnoascus verrucosus]
MPPLHLQHLHLPLLTPYATAQSLQSSLVRAFLTHKHTPSTPLPPPTLLTFTPPPIYTTGRRELPSSYPPSLRATLRAPLDSNTSGADFTPASRGGLITFHGPGQLVIYPTISLNHPPSFRKPTSPRCYVSLLETVTIRTLAHYGIEGFRTADPGVWVNPRHNRLADPSSPSIEGATEKKIAALGVHLRRNITSHGVGLNISTDLRWFDRIVACGIEGKGVTSLAEEGVVGKTVEEVARVWVDAFAAEVGAEVVRSVEVGEVLEQVGVGRLEDLVEGRGGMGM